MKKIRVTLFKPLPALKPSKRSMNSHTVFSTSQVMKVLPDGHHFFIEPKRDGIRCQLHRDGGKVLLLSEEEKRMSPDRIAIIIKEGKQIFPQRCIIDGELLLKGSEGKTSQGHQAIAGYIHHHGAPHSEEVKNLRYYYWDILYKDGKDLTSTPLFQRKKLLNFHDTEHIKENSYSLVPKELNKIRSTIQKEKSAEGAMIKAADMTYWQDNMEFKVKHFFDLDVKVVKVIPRINGEVAICADREGNIVGTTYKQSYLKMKPGQIIRVMVTKIYRHKDPKTGKWIYRWYSPIVKRPGELSGGLKTKEKIIKRQPKEIDSQATLEKMWETSGQINK